MKVTGIVVVLMSEVCGTQTIWLPNPPEGKYCSSPLIDADTEITLSIEANDNKWIAQCSSPACLRNIMGVVCEQMEITDKSFFFIDGIENRCVVYAEICDSSTSLFRN